MILESIRYNLANLFRLSGRETRAQFWPYAIAVFLLGGAVDVLLIIPAMMEMMERIQAFVLAHPEGLPPPVPGQNPLPPELMPNFAGMMGPMAVVQVATILLWLSAVVRRLHDRDRSGWWGAIVLPFQLIGLALAPRLMTAMMTMEGRPSSLMMLSALNSLFYWAAAIALIILLAGESSP